MSHVHPQTSGLSTLPKLSYIHDCSIMSTQASKTRWSCFALWKTGAWTILRMSLPLEFLRESRRRSVCWVLLFFPEAGLYPKPVFSLFLSLFLIPCCGKKKEDENGVRVRGWVGKKRKRKEERSEARMRKESASSEGTRAPAFPHPVTWWKVTASSCPKESPRPSEPPHPSLQVILKWLDKSSEPSVHV